VVCPTDTIYGLSCSVSILRAVKKIHLIKQREEKKPFLILVSSQAMLKKYCQVTRKQLDYLKKIWPGPVSVILKKKPNLSPIITGGRDSVGVRLPKDDFLIKIIKSLGEPLVSTSLNLSGQEVILDVKQVDSIFSQKNKPDLIVNAGQMRRKKPSRLLDIRDISNIVVLRK
jgi:tRNA threonylcarbamoyl adenosine modification protein (Sua5/YciO/YrdC/YwlC family)